MAKDINDLANDPEPKDTDPEEEFELFKALGWKPEDIQETDTREAYKAWLAEHPSE